MQTTIVPTSSATLVLRVPGDLVSTSADAVRTEAEHLFKQAGAAPTWKLLVLDLTAAAMLDSVGLNVVVTLLKRAKAQGARLQVNYTSPNLLRTFVFTRLDRQIDLVKP